MQQQQQPGMPPFSQPAGSGTAHATPAAPSPISSRPPEETQQQQQQQQVDEVVGSGGGSASATSSFVDHEGLSAAGNEGERSGTPGNRWPRQETLALLKIRSEMDAAFREAALKGPLWEQVSRRMEALGYKRSAKKCREKFENVDKYYKRTKDGRAGRGDGKAYRFFSELEALHGASSSPHPPTSLAPTPVAMAPPAFPAVTTPGMHVADTPPRVVVAPPPQPAPATPAVAATDAACMMTPGDVSFSSGSDGEDTEETGDGGGKRKREGGDSGGGGSGKVMRFFEGLMRQVMERQEAMQQRFIEAIERREHERMIHEEAWRRQEVARLAREQDALAQERAMAASRDAAVVSFIQRITGQTIPMPAPSVAVAAPPPALISALTTVQPPPLQPTPVASAAPAQQQQPPPTIQLAPKAQAATPVAHPTPPAPAQPPQQQPSKEDNYAASASASASPSRWPKAEVHALIQLRTELEARYQDSGPKGPLWEDISAGMRRLGYSRSAKRCKEKWENINKYFKKVKESNKKRPEDSKTCPYYHQLDALYRTKALSAASISSAPPQPTTVLAAVPLSQTPPHKGNGNGCATSSDNGEATNRLFSVEGGNGVATKKQQEQEGIITKETTATTEPRPQPVSMNDSYVNDGADSDSMDDDDDDEFDDDDEGDVGGSKTMQQYEIQFQRQQPQKQQSGGAASGPGPAAASGSFLTMVHH